MKPLSILLLDDDELHRLKFKKISENLDFDCSISEARNGERALQCLKTNHSFDVIITDLNMPVMDGFQFLSSINSNSKFNKIPVVVMSTSDSIWDMKRCYEFGISGYFYKSLKYSDYSLKVTSLLQYWEKASLSSRLYS